MGAANLLRCNMTACNNFFTLFGLPVAFEIDKEALKKSFLSLQKTHHPDQSTQTNPNHMATLINHAYHTLQNDNQRAMHLLEIAGVACELNTSINDWDFLDEMMEFRMTLDDTQNPNELRTLLDTINGQKLHHNEAFNTLYQAQNWQDAKIIAQKLQFLDKLSDDVADKITQSLNINADDDSLYV